jgi:glutaredoxin
LAGDAPTIASASEVDPEQPRLTLRLPPLVLAVPLLALAAFGVIRTEPWLPRTAASSLERAAAAPASDEALDDGAGAPSGNDTLAAEPLADSEPAAAGPSAQALSDTAPEPEPLDQGQTERATAGNDPPRDVEPRETTVMALARVRDQVEVVVYYAPWCGYCTKARAYLAQRGIRNVEHDVDADTSASARHRRLNPRGSVPTIEIDGQVLVGFDAGGIERAIERAARARLSRERGS